MIWEDNSYLPFPREKSSYPPSPLADDFYLPSPRAVVEVVPSGILLTRIEGNTVVVALSRGQASAAVSVVLLPLETVHERLLGYIHVSVVGCRRFGDGDGGRGR